MALPQRKSIRLKNYDYSSNGAYFVTICTENRKCMLGEIWDGTMYLSTYGKIAYDEMINTNAKRVKDGISIEKFVVCLIMSLQSGNPDIMNISLEMKTHIMRFGIILIIIFYYGRKINFTTQTPHNLNKNGERKIFRSPIFMQFRKLQWLSQQLQSSSALPCEADQLP